MYPFAFAFGAVMVLIAPHPTAAWLNTAQLQSACEVGLQNPTPDNPAYALCTGLILGTLSADALEKNVICAPPDLDTKTVLRIFIARAASERDKKAEGAIILYRALAESYPCR